MDRIDAMQAFVAVADLQGFAPAARKLGLAPSGVTRLVAALEDHLGARLLQRTTRKVALTDVGARYLERVRRILADVEEAEGSAQAERTRPSGRLVVSAPIGFGRLHVSPVMSAYLTRYPEVSGESQAVGPHDQPGGRRRRSCGADRSPAGFQPGGAPCRRDAADRGGLESLSDGSTARRRRRQAIASHQTILFGDAARRTGILSKMAAKSASRRTPRFLTNSADAAIQHAEQGGGLTQVLAYQAAEAIKAGRLENRTGEIRAAAAADPYRLSDLAAVVGQGANLHRSRGRDQRLAFRQVTAIAFSSEVDIRFA